MSDPAPGGDDAKKSVSSSVEVGVDPDTAFAVIRDLIDPEDNDLLELVAAAIPIAMRLDDEIAPKAREGRACPATWKNGP